MITDEQFQELDDLVRAHTEGCRPVELAQITLLRFILVELRTIRQINSNTNEKITQLANQFDRVSACGNSLTVETAR